jgi:Tol biopolymer transport system component
MNADGSGIAKLITPGAGDYDGAPSVSPNGKTITFERCNEGCDIWTANIDGSSAKNLTNNGVSWDPMFVNNKIVYVAWNDNGYNNIYSMDPNGQNQKQLTSTPADEMFDEWWW